MQKVKKFLSILLSVILVTSLISKEGIYVYSSETNQNETQYNEVDSIDKLSSEHDYACNMDKTWIYRVENAAELKVTFSEETALENGADFIYIYDKNDTLIQKCTGLQLSAKTVIVPYDTVKIRLVSDETNVAYGFSVTKVAVMKDISVKSNPDTNEFLVGQDIDYTGFELQGNYDDGTNRDIAESEYSFSDISNDSPGLKVIIVTFRNLVTDFNITYNEPELVKIEIISLPDKTNYSYAQELDLTGIKISADASDGRKYILSNGYTVSGYDSTKIGEQQITVDYKSLTVNFIVTVSYPFKYTTTSNKVTITGLSDAGITKLVIPSEVDGNEVVAVASSSFKNNQSIKTVELPDTISEIGEYAFSDCYRLENVNIPTGVTVIKPSVFYNCYRLEKIVIPENVTEIGNSAFANCSELTVNSIPDKVTSIGTGAFKNCAKITSVKFPDGLKYIGAEAYWGCKGITEIEVPDSVTEIGDGAFGGTSITTLKIPFVGGTRTSGYGIGSVLGYIFGNSSDGINKKTVQYFYSDSAQTKKEQKDFYIPQTLKKIEITDAKNIPPYAFNNCNKITEIALNEGIENIGTSAFTSCNNLQSVNIPTGVTVIKPSVFYNCYRLEKIVIPENVTEIGNSAFANCSELTVNSIPDKVTSIGTGAFKNCAKITSVKFPDGLKYIGAEAYWGCKGITEIEVPDSVTEIGDGAFGGTSITTLKIPFVGGTRTSGYGIGSVLGYIFGNSSDGINKKTVQYFYSDSAQTKKEQKDFYIPQTLKKIEITDAKNIPPYAFNNCNKITEIALNEGIENIGTSAFTSCNNLQSVNIPTGVTVIKPSVFYNCYRLEKIVIPENVTEIGNSAFANCSELTVNSIPDKVTSIGTGAFKNCAKITSVKFPDGLKYIGAEAYWGCKGITEIEVPDSVTEIGDGAFGGTSITTLKIPFVGGTRTSGYGIGSVFGYIFGSSSDGINNKTVQYFYSDLAQTNMGEKDFYIPQTLKKIEITDAKNIPPYAFFYCSMLNEIKLNEGVESLGNNLFRGCSGLKEIYLPNSITTIGKDAFWGCDIIITVNKESYGLQYAIDNNIPYSTIAKIELDKNELILYKSQDAILNAKVTNLDGSVNINPYITWTTSNPDVLTVSDGKIMVKGPGKAVITASCEGREDTCEVSIFYPLEKIDFDDASTTINIGTKKLLNINYTPDNTTDSKNIVWSSSDGNIVSVDEKGQITGMSNGSATITATSSDGLTATIDVTVLVPASSIELNRDVIKMEKGTTEKLEVSVLPSDTTDSYKWRSSNPEIVSVDEQGNIHALANGTATINAVISEQIFAACEVTVHTSANEIVLKEDVKNIFIDDEIQLEATLVPEDSTDSVVWSSTDESILKISEDGTLKILKAGTVEVIATATSGVSKQCKININNNISDIDIKMESDEYEFSGKEITPAVTVSYDNKILVKDIDYSVAYFDNISIGRAKLVVTGIGRYSGVVEIPFSIKLVHDIVINKKNISLSEGESYQLVLKYNSIDMSSNKMVSWTSSDEKVAIVNQNGYISAISVGNCTIKACIDDKEVSCELSVVKGEVKPTLVKINKTKSILYVGEKERLTVKVFPADAENKSVMWYSGNKKIVTVNNKGVVNAKSAGKVTVTVKTYNGLKAECEITVKKVKATKIRLNKSKVIIKKGKSIYLKATISPKNVTDKTIKWSSNNKSVATVNSKGKVTAKRGGTAIITAKTTNGKKAKCHVNVKESSKKVKLSRTHLEINRGKTYKLKAILYPLTSTDKIKWTSSNRKIVTVSNKGVVKGIKAGKAVITAKATSGKKATCKVTVNIPAKAIKLDKKLVTLAVGKTVTLRATVSPKNTTDKIKWSSSNDFVASVNSKGVVKAKNSGTAKIEAKTTSGKRVTCKIRVIKPRVNVDANVKKLKSYIMNHGKTNDDGNKFISDTVSSGSSEYSVGIIYELDKDRIHFLSLSSGYTSGGISYKTAMNMYLGSNNVDYMVIYGDYYHLKANATPDLSNYDGKINIYFNCIESFGFSKSDIQELANAELQLAFESWNSLIRETTGMRMNDIGFTEYR